VFYAGRRTPGWIGPVGGLMLLRSSVTKFLSEVLRRRVYSP